jgi:crossover junction endodeoxyribonuclease RuvC
MTGTGRTGSGLSRLRVLGIDPGTRVLGWGLVESDGARLVPVAHGALRANGRHDVIARLHDLGRRLRDVLEEHRPAEAALEKAFHGVDARAALTIGEGRGMALFVLGEAGIPVTDYANNVVKRAVTGAGRAPKGHAQSMVARLLGLAEPPTPFDAADALALAICHHRRRLDPRAGPAGATGLPPRVAEAIRRARAQDRLRRPGRPSGSRFPATR